MAQFAGTLLCAKTPHPTLAFTNRIYLHATDFAAYKGAAPPQGEVWTGHSLRKGGASASDAAGVSLARICHVGGWSIKSSAVKDYIDPTCPDSAAGRRYFGWLLPL